MSKTILRQAQLILASSALTLTTIPIAKADVASDIMALARAQWQAEIDKSPIAEQMANVASDYTEFNPDVPTRLDGKSMAMAMGEGYNKDNSHALISDMANPKVQVYGDTAILTYNFVGLTQDKDGKVKPNTAKSTRVYVRQGSKWMLVHANFAPVMAPPAN